MDQNTIYDLAKQMDCSIDTGLTTEIQDYLNRQLNIKESLISLEENIIISHIKLKKNCLSEVKKIFFDLLHFIEYSSVFYVREEKGNLIEYTLLSSTIGNKGFLLRITFN
ncbi:hypothetical protein [Chengkuizengella sediminis]|uniref:hypothetical protein n=1 Tax=Chengkuizengella sediminis TaxID=1885917 RepID=UPI0013897FC7|nr:hypothetical protein [Chengkuizengella sediminis]NDI35367.1 hypothetical protein [Chengkuizengella sediminis]